MCTLQDPQFVNKLLGKNFAVMQKMGKPVLMPFLQVHTAPVLVDDGAQSSAKTMLMVHMHMLMLTEDHMILSRCDFFPLSAHSQPSSMSRMQDVPQFGPLALTMGGQMVNDPLFVPEILKHVGPTAFVDWFVHFVGLGGYTALNALAPPLRAVAGRLPSRQRFLLNRQLEAWRYGSGQDYEL